MPDQTAAAHGACRSGGVFPQYSSLWSGVLPHVSENPDGAATRKYFPASRFRRSVMQWGYLNRRMNRFFLARPVFSLMLGAPDRPHDAMTGPGLISLFCFLITAAYFLRGGMCAGIVLCMGLAFFSFSRRGWLRRSVTFLLQVSLTPGRWQGSRRWTRGLSCSGLPFRLPRCCSMRRPFYGGGAEKRICPSRSWPAAAYFPFPYCFCFCWMRWFLYVC